jgi:hypothetical protein
VRFGGKNMLHLPMVAWATIGSFLEFSLFQSERKLKSGLTVTPSDRQY